MPIEIFAIILEQCSVKSRENNRTRAPINGAKIIASDIKYI